MGEWECHVSSDLKMQTIHHLLKLLIDPLEYGLLFHKVRGSLQDQFLDQPLLESAASNVNDQKVMTTCQQV